MKDKFVHLHVHTEYSLLDGLSKTDHLLKHIKENDMDSCAITDHGVMYGVIEFYKRAKKEGVKPIIGMEAYTTNVDHKSRPERGRMRNFHLLLLAKNNEGYKNLMKLTSIAHLEGYYYRPRFDRETLLKYSKGLIATSACAQGELASHLVEGNLEEGLKVAKWFLEVFGKDYFLEIQRHEYEKYAKRADKPEIKSLLLEQSENEKKINDGVLVISRKLGIPIVATNDAHYVEKKDASAQDALVCIATGKNIADIKRLRFIDSPNFYIKNPSEMAELFVDVPDAIKNTLSVAERCDVEIILDKWFFPEYELSEGKTPDQELDIKAWDGIKERITKVTSQVKERLTYELSIIKQKGYSTYFLIVSDVARWCNENGIITNTRGSTAGSLVAYALGIVNINPLNYDLPFERFLTPWRPSPPDIDFDIADDRREGVIDYITQKYGKEKVAQICTFGRMLARGAVRDVARVLGYPYSVGDRISKAIPLGSQGFPMSIEKALGLSPVLKELYENDKDSKKVIELARQVEGSARHVSVHAAGVVIAPSEIKNFTPIQLDPEGKKVITQYDMDALDPNVSPGEAVGLLKFDLLGLRNLTIMGAALRIVTERSGMEINLLKIPLTDSKTYEMLSRGETMGVFQLSGSGMTRYLRELKPTRVEDLMAMVALYRPGPMAQIPEYIFRKNNPSKVSYFDERMKEYLGKSYGLLVYQDDVFLTAIKIAGYSWEEADKFRKAVGKKIPSEMEKQRDKFIEGAIENGLEKGRAEELFKLIEPFSGYGFNKAHAASYGMIAYWTAYMKANYPVEFMCALLTAESGDSEKIAGAIGECRRMGIKVLAPDINESMVGFKIVNDSIRFGLNAIKNVGKAAIDEILSARTDGPFLSFPDFLSRIESRKVNKKVLESLIKVGALSVFGSRASLLAGVDSLRAKVVSKSKAGGNQQGLFSTDAIDATYKNTDFSIAIEEFSDEEIQSLETQLLGFSLSAKPVSEILKKIENMATHKIYEIQGDSMLTENVKIAAVVTEVRVIVTKKSAQEMAFVKVRDDTGSIDLVVFPRTFQTTRAEWVDNKPLVISGKVDSRDEEAALIVEGVVSNPSAKGNDRLYIRIPKGAKTEWLNKLKGLLLSSPGEQGVSLVFESQKKKIDLDIKVNWDENLAHQISNVFEGEVLD